MSRPPSMPDPSEPHDVTKEPITVYITGFGPFRKFTSNPSWKLTSSFLPSTLISPNISIVPHPESVRVAYQSVDTLIPQIHASKKFDYILHTGVGLPGSYEIETVAHESGYVKADVDGLVPGGHLADPESERKDGGGGAGDTGKESDTTAETHGGTVYKTDLDVDGICKMIQACRIIPEETPEAPICVKRSGDAGRYLCEYIFRTSLRCAEDPTRRVLFLHVPPENKPYSVETGKRLLEQLVIAFVTEGERLRKQWEGEL